MLPLTNNINLGKELGMRHRAAVGISERSDAISIVVSEQTGTISLAVDGMLKRHLDIETFEMLLKSELIHKYDRRRVRKAQDIKVSE
jgi:diadenylate cyclase